jgi:hypothetical protein
MDVAALDLLSSPDSPNDLLSQMQAQREQAETLDLEEDEPAVEVQQALETMKGDTIQTIKGTEGQVAFADTMTQGEGKTPTKLK